MALNFRQWLMIAGGAVIIVIAIAAFYLAQLGNGVNIQASGTATGTTGTPVASSDLMVAGPLGEMALGDPNAKNVIIEYASMTCPHCGAWNREVFPALKAQYIDTGKVYFIFRDFPLDALATSAIMVAHCVPTRFFPLVELMFDQQPSWAYVADPKAALQNLVKQAGIGADQFNGCLTNQSLLDGVQAVQDRAKDKFGVGATPTFFINGGKAEGEQPLSEIAKLLVS